MFAFSPVSPRVYWWTWRGSIVTDGTLVTRGVDRFLIADRLDSASRASGGPLDPAFLHRPEWPHRLASSQPIPASSSCSLSLSLLASDRFPNCSLFRFVPDRRKILSSVNRQACDDRQANYVRSVDGSVVGWLLAAASAALTPRWESYNGVILQPRRRASLLSRCSSFRRPKKKIVALRVHSLFAVLLLLCHCTQGRQNVYANCTRLGSNSTWLDSTRSTRRARQALLAT